MQVETGRDGRARGPMPLKNYELSPLTCTVKPLVSHVDGT